MTFLDKLNMLMGEKSISRVDLAKGADVPYTTISSFYEKGTENIKLSTLRKLAAYFDCSLDFLADDEVTERKAITVKPLYNMDIAKKYHALDEYGKRAIDALLDIEASRVQHAAAEQNSLPKTRFIDRYCLPVSAGTGVYVDGNLQEYDMVEVPVNEKTAKASFVLTVKGDSMEPRYSDGDEILIQSMPSVDIGDLGIFILNDEVYFKRLGKKGLESLNPKYPVINVTENDTIVCKGKVIGKL
jgi:repressor LexA